MQSIDLIKTIADQAAQIEKLQAELDEAVLERDDAIKRVYSPDNRVIDIGTINMDDYKYGTFVGSLPNYRIRLRCESVVIEAEMPRGHVTARYDNGPVFKWLGDDFLKIYHEGEKACIGLSIKGDLYADIIRPDRKTMMHILRDDYSRSYNLSFSEKYNTIECKDEVSADMGECTLKIAATIKHTNVVTFGYPVIHNFLEMRTGKPPLFYIDDYHVFDCATMTFESNPWNPLCYE